MLRSMTGFGQATGNYEKFTVKAEIKAVNGKFLDINLRMPKLVQNKETELRNHFGKLIERGTVVLSIVLEFKNPADLLQPLNKEVVNFYLDEVSQIEQRLGIDKGSLTGSVFNIPNALQTSEKDLNEEEWKQILSTIQDAFKAFESFRQQEGDETARGIRALVDRIQGLSEEVAAMEPARLEAIRQKIKTDLENFIGREHVDPSRFEQELLYYIEKIDIAEEKHRLNNHCLYFLQTMQDSSTGKKLGFISQEMGREINTMGAKANYFPIQQKIVEMKDELEKIKEQLSNVI